MKDTWEHVALLLVLLAGFGQQQDITTTEESSTDIPFEDLETTCGNNTEMPTFGMRGCACDPECRKYGDCCPDSPFFKPEEQRLGASPFFCSSMATVYIIGKCPPGWVDPVIRHHCEHPDTTYRDPTRDAPVTSLTTNFSYVNSYCAACNRDLHPDTMEIWALKINCNINPRFLNYSDDLNYKHLVYDTEWYLNLTIDNVKTRFSCKVYPVMPVAAEIRGRLCEDNVVSSCPEDWTDDEVKEECEAYTSHLCFGDVTYRNRHCVVCNNASRGIDCLRYTFYSTRFGGSHTPSFSMLLDWRNMKEVHQCDKKEIYDPLSHLCRPVIDIDKYK